MAVPDADCIQMETLARRVLKDARSTPEEVSEARYLLYVLERERCAAAHRVPPPPLPGQTVKPGR